MLAMCPAEVSMLEHALTLAALLLSMALLLCCYRLWRGPALWDRVLALDTLYVTAIGLLLVQDMRMGRPLYFEVALAIAALGFIATVTLAKYLMRGAFIPDAVNSGDKVSSTTISSSVIASTLIEQSANRGGGDD
jgi:multicomponent K+:H+ antiporter subunit F